jgi:hypothetical protein
MSSHEFREFVVRGICFFDSGHVRYDTLAY